MVDDPKYMTVQEILDDLKKGYDSHIIAGLWDIKGDVSVANNLLGIRDHSLPYLNSKGGGSHLEGFIDDLAQYGETYGYDTPIGVDIINPVYFSIDPKNIDDKHEQGFLNVFAKDDSRQGLLKRYSSMNSEERKDAVVEYLSADQENGLKNLTKILTQYKMDDKLTSLASITLSTVGPILANEDIQNTIFNDYIKPRNTKTIQDIERDINHAKDKSKDPAKNSNISRALRSENYSMPVVDRMGYWNEIKDRVEGKNGGLIADKSAIATYKGIADYMIMLDIANSLDESKNISFEDLVKANGNKVSNPTDAVKIVAIERALEEHSPITLNLNNVDPNNVFYEVKIDEEKFFAAIEDARWSFDNTAYISNVGSSALKSNIYRTAINNYFANDGITLDSKVYDVAMDKFSQEITSKYPQYIDINEREAYNNNRTFYDKLDKERGTEQLTLIDLKKIAPDMQLNQAIEYFDDKLTTKMHHYNIDSKNRGGPDKGLTALFTPFLETGNADELHPYLDKSLSELPDDMLKKVYQQYEDGITHYRYVGKKPIELTIKPDDDLKPSYLNKNYKQTVKDLTPANADYMTAKDAYEDMSKLYDSIIVKRIFEAGEISKIARARPNEHEASFRLELGGFLGKLEAFVEVNPTASIDEFIKKENSSLNLKYFTPLKDGEKSIYGYIDGAKDIDELKGYAKELGYDFDNNTTASVAVGAMETFFGEDYTLDKIKEKLDPSKDNDSRFWERRDSEVENPWEGKDERYYKKYRELYEEGKIGELKTRFKYDDEYNWVKYSGAETFIERYAKPYFAGEKDIDAIFDDYNKNIPLYRADAHYEQKQLLRKYEVVDKNGVVDITAFANMQLEYSQIDAQESKKYKLYDDHFDRDGVNNEFVVFSDRHSFKDYFKETTGRDWTSADKDNLIQSYNSSFRTSEKTNGYDDNSLPADHPKKSERLPFLEVKEDFLSLAKPENGKITLKELAEKFPDKPLSFFYEMNKNDQLQVKEFVLNLESIYVSTQPMPEHGRRGRTEYFSLMNDMPEALLQPYINAPLANIPKELLTYDEVSYNKEVSEGTIIPPDAYEIAMKIWNHVNTTDMTENNSRPEWKGHFLNPKDVYEERANLDLLVMHIINNEAVDTKWIKDTYSLTDQKTGEVINVLKALNEDQKSVEIAIDKYKLPDAQQKIPEVGKEVEWNEFLQTVRTDSTIHEVKWDQEGNPPLYKYQAFKENGDLVAEFSSGDERFNNSNKNNIAFIEIDAATSVNKNFYYPNSDPISNLETYKSNGVEIIGINIDLTANSGNGLIEIQYNEGDRDRDVGSHSMPFMGTEDNPITVETANKIIEQIKDHKHLRSLIIIGDSSDHKIDFDDINEMKNLELLSLDIPSFKALDQVSNVIASNSLTFLDVNGSSVTDLSLAFTNENLEIRNVDGKYVGVKDHPLYKTPDDDKQKSANNSENKNTDPNLQKTTPPAPTDKEKVAEKVAEYGTKIDEIETKLVELGKADKKDNSQIIELNTEKAVFEQVVSEKDDFNNVGEVEKRKIELNKESSKVVKQLIKDTNQIYAAHETANYTDAQLTQKLDDMDIQDPAVKKIVEVIKDNASDQLLEKVENSYRRRDYENEARGQASADKVNAYNDDMYKDIMKNVTFRYVGQFELEAVGMSQTSFESSEAEKQQQELKRLFFGKDGDENSKTGSAMEDGSPSYLMQFNRKMDRLNLTTDDGTKITWDNLEQTTNITQESVIASSFRLGGTGAASWVKDEVKELETFRTRAVEKYVLVDNPAASGRFDYSIEAKRAKIAAIKEQEEKTELVASYESKIEGVKLELENVKLTDKEKLELVIKQKVLTYTVSGLKSGDIEPDDFENQINNLQERVSLQINANINEMVNNPELEGLPWVALLKKDETVAVEITQDIEESAKDLIDIIVEQERTEKQAEIEFKEAEEKYEARQVNPYNEVNVELTKGKDDVEITSEILESADRTYVPEGFNLKEDKISITDPTIKAADISYNIVDLDSNGKKEILLNVNGETVVIPDIIKSKNGKNAEDKEQKQAEKLKLNIKGGEEVSLEEINLDPSLMRHTNDAKQPTRGQ